MEASISNKKPKTTKEKVTTATLWTVLTLLIGNGAFDRFFKTDENNDPKVLKVIVDNETAIKQLRIDLDKKADKSEFVSYSQYFNMQVTNLSSKIDNQNGLLMTINDLLLRRK